MLQLLPSKARTPLAILQDTRHLCANALVQLRLAREALAMRGPAFGRALAGRSRNWKSFFLGALDGFGKAGVMAVSPVILIFVRRIETSYG